MWMILAWRALGAITGSPKWRCPTGQGGNREETDAQFLVVLMGWDFSGGISILVSKPDLHKWEKEIRSPKRGEKGLIHFSDFHRGLIANVIPSAIFSKKHKRSRYLFILRGSTPPTLDFMACFPRYLVDTDMTCRMVKYGKMDHLRGTSPPPL